MFISVVAEPTKNQQFDGKIYMKRIAEDRAFARMTCRNNFHHDRNINDALKSGEWQRLYPDNPTLPTSEFFRLIVDVYDLSEEIEEQLCLRYETYENGMKRIKTLEEEEQILHNKNIR
jgi:hypothetical protein